MFSIRTFRSARLLRYTRSVGPSTLPIAMENVYRIMQRLKNDFGRANMSASVLIVLRWNVEEDPVYDLAVASWLSILNMFWSVIFPVPGTPILPDAHRERLIRCGLTPALAPDLILLSSHTTALLTNAEDANVSLSNGGISAGDRTYVSDPVQCVRGLFSNQECGLEPLVFFLQEWERAWSDPNGFFSGLSGITRFLIDELEHREEGVRSCFSLELYISLFVAFFNVFVSRHSLSRSVQSWILEKFFQDISNRLSIFHSLDLPLQLMQAYLRVSGILCASCNPNEWLAHSPLLSQVIRLPSGIKVHSCCSIWEERMLLHCLRLSLSQDQCVRWTLLIYGESGREHNPFFNEPSMVQGGLSCSPIWATWRSVYVPLLSQFLLNFAEVHLRPPSLVESSALSIYHAMLSGSIFLNLPFYCTIVDIISLMNFYENTSVSGRSWNCAWRERSLQNLRLQVQPAALILRTLHMFSNQLNLDASSSHEDRLRAHNLLFVMLKLLPLCQVHFVENARLSSLAEWFLKHFFVSHGLLNQGSGPLSRMAIRRRNSVFSLGWERIAQFLLSLVLHALDRDEDVDLLAQMRVGFFRHFCVLYEQSLS